MELREYIRVVMRGIWIIIPLTMLTVTITAIFSYSQPPIYESNSKYVTRLDSTLSSIGDTIYGLDTLLGRQRIFVTYCDVMSSDSSISRAMELLGIAPDAIDIGEGYTVVCSPIPESNVLQLTVRGPSTVVVERLNQAVGQIGVERVNDLYNFFPIEVLDPVELVEGPVAPNHLTSLVLGGALGMILSVSLAFLLDYLRSPQNDYETLSIRDATMGVYKDRYFQRRLGEEFERAKTSYRTLSLAYVSLLHSEDFDIIPEKVQNVLMRRLALEMQNYQPQSNIVAYRGQMVFEILIPERSGSKARLDIQEMVNSLQQRIYSYEGYSTRFDFHAVVVESDGRDGVQVLEQDGLKALAQRDLMRPNTVVFLSKMAKPFGDTEITLQTGEHEAFIFADIAEETGKIPVLDINEMETLPDRSDDALYSPEKLKSKIKSRHLSQPSQSEGTRDND